MRAASFAYTSAAFPMLTGTLVTAVGFLPVGFAKSSAGEYTVSIFAVVTIALLVSLVVAVIFTPYIGYKILPTFKAHPDIHEDAVYQKKFYLMFRRLVTWCVRFRKSVVLATALVFAAALIGFALVEQQFFSSSNRPELLIDLQLPEGASIRATQAEVLKMEKLLANDPDIEQQSAYVGGGAPRFYLPLDIQLPNPSFAHFVVLTKSNDARERVFALVQAAFEKDFPMVRGRVNRLENGPPVVTAQIDPLLNPLRARLPPGYHIDIGGAVEESAKGQASVAAVMPLMIFVTITLLMIQLQSLSRTFLVLLTAPLGLIGTTFFLLLFNIPFGFVAMLGVIALSGMIMRNSVILVDQIEQDIAAGKAPWEAIIGSTVRRFRPIMLTAAAAILAMIPLTRSDFWGPMAVAIMGGLLVAKVLTLTFLPALYAAWLRVKEA